jgi:hypothetical protein
MTATSGDALSHVIFQTRQNAVLTKISAPEFQPLAPGKDTRASSLKRIGSCRICMAAMRRHRGTKRTVGLHLTITCLNLFSQKDDCIRK